MWRVCQKAQFTHPDAQTWVKDTFPDHFYAGIKGRGTDDAVAPLLHKAQLDWYVGSLDLQKAFDAASPDLAAQIMLRLGMPSNVLAPILDAWTNQERWIHYLDEIAPASCTVRNSLPQGDSWSMLAMSALLYPCVAGIKQAAPSALHVVYADDRNFATRTAQECIEVTRLWSEWATLLGLQENRQKSQYWHQKVSGRRNLARAGCEPQQIRTDMRILGYHFLPLQDRKLNQTEANRLSDARSRMLRIRSLPGTIARKARLARMTVSPKASWGWVCKRPDKQACAPLLAAAKMIFFWPKHGSMDLILLIAGHQWDLHYLATANAVRMFHRFLRTTQESLGQWPRKLSGWTATLRTGMKDLGWEEQQDSPWVWHHDGLATSLSLNPQSRFWVQEPQLLQRILRESWRFTRFQAWKESARLDAQACPDAVYCPERLQAVQRRQLESHELAVLTGAVISPARFQVMLRSSNDPRTPAGCPWCGLSPDHANWEHVTWGCDAIILPSNIVPGDQLERRLGWPQIHQGRPNWATMDWLVKVRRATLDDRHQSE